MNRRITTALLAACLISGICTYLLGRRMRQAAMAGNRNVLRYVGSAHALEPGAVLKSADLVWTRWPAESPLKGAVTDIASPLGRVVLYPVEAGSPIVERDLAAAGSGGGLASRIPPGLRALALSSDEVVGVAGFLAPGSHVDVLVTYKAASAPEPVTATVLENAEVLTVGQQMEPDPAGKPATATVVTLLLTPLAAERVVLASTQGKVHFVLRNGLDREQAASAPVSLAWLDPGRSDLTRSMVPGAGGNPVSPAGPIPAGPPRVSGRRTRSSGIETVFGGEASAEGASEKQP